MIFNTWYVAAWADELGDSILPRTICNQALVIFRDAGGKVAALEDRCCHRAAPLRFGNLVPEGIQCSYHGLVFDCTGNCVHIPSQNKIPSQARVRSFPVVEKDEMVWIWMGDPALAREEEILEYPYHRDTERWPHKHDVIHLKANNMLLVDNLMDLTHVGVLHKATIGGEVASHAQASTEVIPSESGLSYVRWLLDSVPPPTFQKGLAFKGRVDRWQDFRYVAPSHVVQWSGAMDVGRGAVENRDQDGAFSIRLFHSLTPETDETCFYFWSSANGYRQDDPQATDELFAELKATFAEDKVIVEGQQERLDERGEAGLIQLASDAVRMHMRRINARLLARESLQPGASAQGQAAARTTV